MKIRFALLLAALCSTLGSASEAGIRGFGPDQAANEQAWEQKARALPDPTRIARYSQQMTQRPHLAGSPESKAVAEYIAGSLREWGLDTQIEEFEALLPRPKMRSLELLGPAPY